MYLEETLAARVLPSLLTFADGTPVTRGNAGERQNEMRAILQREIYGEMPSAPDFVRGRVLEDARARDFAGKGTKQRIEITFGVDGKEFSFPTVVALPKGKEKPPFVVMLNFRDAIPDEYLPAEELIDRGVGFASLCYRDVTADDGDFSDKLAGVLTGGKQTSDTACGKIALWAYAASRVLDYVLASCGVDTTRIAVAGHSRLGKTALVAGAFDERFTCAYSNDSGCSGAALTRGKGGEHVDFITRTFPFWFCKNYARYAGQEENLPFDQHFLLASIAPRRVYVASAGDDAWADPVSEYLCCASASAFWPLFGKMGFAGADRAPEEGDVFHDGSIGYHLRSGAHYFSREDWNRFLDFFLKDGKEKPADGRIRNQKKYLFGKSFVYTDFIPSGNNDHAHCEFCMKKLLSNDKGYCDNERRYHWVCEDCFRDLQAEFEWKTV